MSLDTNFVNMWRMYPTAGCSNFEHISTYNGTHLHCAEIIGRGDDGDKLSCFKLENDCTFV